MSWIRDIYGLLGCTMVFLFLLTVAFRFTRTSFALRTAVSIVGVILFFVPFGGTSLAFLLRGAAGDISIPTFLLCATGLTANLLANTEPPKWAQLVELQTSRFRGGSILGFFLLVIAVAAFFYPMTMGFTLMDPYGWGYTSRLMLIACLLLCILFELASQRTAATLIAAGVFGYALDVMASTNLWDYLFDPILVLISVVGALFIAFNSLMRKLSLRKTSHASESGTSI